MYLRILSVGLKVLDYAYEYIIIIWFPLLFSFVFIFSDVSD